MFELYRVRTGALSAKIMSRHFLAHQKPMRMAFCGQMISIQRWLVLMIWGKAFENPPFCVIRVIIGVIHTAIIE
jgi:hypothetical protein